MKFNQNTRARQLPHFSNGPTTPKHNVLNRTSRFKQLDHRPESLWSDRFNKRSKLKTGLNWGKHSKKTVKLSTVKTRHGLGQSNWSSKKFELLNFSLMVCHRIMLPCNGQLHREVGQALRWFIKSRGASSGLSH